MIEILMYHGLTEAEAHKFIALLNQMDFNEEDREGYDEAYEDGFEGGPSIAEALIALRLESDPNFGYVNPADKVEEDEENEEDLKNQILEGNEAADYFKVREVF